MDNLKEMAAKATMEVLNETCLQSGDIFVVGCSTSEIGGGVIGKGSNIGIAKEVFEGIISVLEPRGIFLAAQCCEHLNRAIVIEREALRGNKDDIVNVVPHIKAGGSFSTTAFERFKDAVVVEEIKADAGMDIGNTLIGMHLRKVAVPLRIDTKMIGQASVIGARTRPKFVGGYRANYDSGLAKGWCRTEK